MICTTRRPRVQKVYMPHFGNIINEFLNTPVQDVINNGGKNITSPAVNVITEDDKYVLEMAVPGHVKKDISITIEDDVLMVKSNKEAGKIDGEFRLREFNYSGFERSFSLPETVDQNKVEAAFKNGILTLTLLKKEEAKPQPVQTISIK